MCGRNLASLVRASALVSSVIHSSSVIEEWYALIRLPTSSSIRCLATGEKCRSTYTLPTASPRAPSTSATPRFQRSRSWGVPCRVVP